MIKSNTNVLLSENQKVLQDIIGGELLEDVNIIVKEVFRSYYFDLNTEEFITPFAIHIKTLYERIKYNSFIRNPLKESIKSSSPLLFDMAIFISNTISKMKNCQLPEDEAAFIALHLGNVIEKQKDKQRKIETVLMIPDYIDMGNRIQDEILLDFDRHLNVSAIISDQQELTQRSKLPELILTMIELDMLNFLDSTIIKLEPFYGIDQKNKILKQIEELEKKRKKEYILEKMDRFFNETLFFSREKDQDRNILLKKMTNRMYKEGLVNVNFYEGVLHREGLSSTAFGDVAIPHHVMMDSPETAVAVALLPEGLQWNETSKVKVVFLVAINSHDSHFFHIFYEEIIQLFSDSQVINDISNVDNFELFKRKILEQL